MVLWAATSLSVLKTTLPHGLLPLCHWQRCNVGKMKSPDIPELVSDRVRNQTLALLTPQVYLTLDFMFWYFSLGLEDLHFFNVLTLQKFQKVKTNCSIKKVTSLTCSCPVFPAPFIEEAIFAPLYILASFVKNKVPISSWVYFWAFYLVPLVYISVFMPVPYCLDDCSFVV